MAGSATGGRGNRLVLRRLQQLFDSTTGASGHPSTGRGISEKAKSLGYDLSTSYILSLRNGDRTNPSLEALEALAAVFSVPMSYFFLDDPLDQMQADSAVLAAMRNSTVRGIALTAARMSPQAQQALATMAGELQRMDTATTAEATVRGLGVGRRPAG
ncbi:XRE family transcriptional regulator [Kineococcus sp. SYSU DK003]|uniref:XRE family transcriptional regulator n=1 Tax=Kineococcus sp. SYSU DK003 TaxID=3383124 RepID=UPI003D7EA3FF